MSTDLALAAERLRDDVEALRRKLRKAYAGKVAQVHSAKLKREAATIAERGLVDLTGSEDFREAVGDDLAANLSIEFQRLLTASGGAAKRSTYDDILTRILKDFAANIVIPLKQSESRSSPSALISKHDSEMPAAAFLGHSFAAVDLPIVVCVKETLQLLGIEVITGERPRAETISEKVKRLIDEAPMFVGLYTRGGKIARRQTWTTSAWVIEEKAYAVAKRKKLLLLKEQGIDSIGGMQGDYEYIDFTRAELQNLVLRLLRVFEIDAKGFAQ